MKKSHLIAYVLFLSAIAFSQTPNWKWATAACGYTAAGISTDANGNCYVVGGFGNGTGNPAIFGNYTLTGSGTSNMAVVKYDSLGNFIWAKTVTADISGGFSIKTDANGNSYVLGSFQSASLVIGSVTLTAPNSNSNVFVTKFNAAGNVVWASILDAVSPATYGGFSISIDGMGNSFIGGRFGSNINDSIMFYKYNNTGNLVWKKYAKGSGTNWNVSSISNDASGNTYIAGTLACATLTFNSTSITNSSAGRLLFVVKYDVAGNVVWAKSSGTYPSLYGASITTDALGNSYVAGSFIGNYAAFGGTVLTNLAGGNGSYDIFIVKFDVMGNVIWAKRGGGLLNDQALGITNDISGNVYITGFFYTDAVFETLSLYSNGVAEAFIVKYDPAGNAIWAKSGGGTFNDGGTGISANANGNIYMSGYFTVKSYWDNITLQNCDSISNPKQLVIAKISQGPDVGLIERTMEESELIFFPNPGKYEVFFETNKFINNAYLYLYNSTGQIVKKMNNISGHNFELEIDDLPAGIYFIRLQQNGSTIKTNKLIIED